MKTKNIFRILIITLFFLTGSIFFAGCSSEDFSIKSIEYTRSEGDDSIYTVTYSNGTTSEFVIVDGKKAITVTNGEDGVDGQDGNDGKTPYIQDGYWYIDGTNTHVRAVGQDGETPYIGENGNWWIGSTDLLVKATGENGDDGIDGKTPYIKDGFWYIGETNTNVRATAQDGQTPYIGTNGNWWIGTTDLLVKAEGQDGKNITIEEIYNKYVEEYGEIEYSDFLNIYFKDTTAENQTKVINECLLSSVKIFTEFRETKLGQRNSAVYGGSGVIYKIESDYTYIITNYHVIYDESANIENGGNFPQKIVGYLYGSESSYDETTGKDSANYPIIDYSGYAIDMEYVGGSATYDVAIVRAETDDIMALNDQVKAIKFADSYCVGETAIAIGNTLGNGTSVTVGIVSVENETTKLSVDGTTRYYRSMRIETPIYHGNSGGGLYNSCGELIGITNSGTETYENINYAIPVSIVKNIAENIMFYAFDGDDETNGAYKIRIGCTVQGVNSKYVYDSTTGIGTIVEEILITELADHSISTDNLNLQVDDIIVSMIINETEYKLNRNFDIGDLILTLRAGDTFKFGLNRNGSLIESNSYTIQSSDLISID